jgi:perosamine synthetase
MTDQTPFEKSEVYMNSSLDRRRFLSTVAGAALLSPLACAETRKPTVLGGKPVRTAPFPSWPVVDSREEKALLDVLHGGKWFRGDGKVVDQFEDAYARVTGSKYCLATANGTSALLASLGALDIGPGDEVIVPPYTFIATVNAVLMFHALPVFVDTDLETFQIDANKVESSITYRTALLMPVHLGGGAADLDAILQIARKRNLPVVEDACQAHLGEWKGRKLGTYGATGCFSFQASKNLNSGEGGAVLAQDEEMIEKCYIFHNNSRGRKAIGYDFAFNPLRGVNLRLTEFQANLLLAQMTRLEEQSKKREQNAQYLTGLLKEIPGILPARMYPGCTRNAYHLYMFRYQKEQFAGLQRSQFLKALEAEGIPASRGYKPLNREPFLKTALESRGFQTVYGKDLYKKWLERNQCPVNDRLCGEAVWFTQNMLLGNQSDMDQIAEAIRKIRANAAEISRTMKA